MMRTAIATLSLLTLLSVGAPLLPRTPVMVQDQPDRGMLAIVRRDGLMRPFAAYRGSRWSSPWPATARNLDLPVDLASVPERWWAGLPYDPWNLHLLAGGAARTIKAAVPRVYRTFCNLGLGVITDYRPPEPLAPATDPLPKAGLAVTAAIDVLPIDRVDLAAPEAAVLVTMLTDELNEAENRTILSTRDYGRWIHPVKAAARPSVPVKLEAWFRAPLGEPGWSVSYLEAVRAYPARPEDEGCGLETVFTGWVYQKQDEPKKMKAQLSARVTYCDRVGVNYMLPFGRIQVAGQWHWVYEFSSIDDEWYVVARVAPARTTFMVEVHAGGGQGCRF